MYLFSTFQHIVYARNKAKSLDMLLRNDPVVKTLHHIKRRWRAKVLIEIVTIFLQIKSLGFLCQVRLHCHRSTLTFWAFILSFLAGSIFRILLPEYTCVFCMGKYIVSNHKNVFNVTPGSKKFRRCWTVFKWIGSFLRASDRWCPSQLWHHKRWQAAGKGGFEPRRSLVEHPIISTSPPSKLLICLCAVSSFSSSTKKRRLTSKFYVGEA